MYPIREQGRYPVAVMVSVLVTVAVFVFMHRLISGGALQIDTDNLMVSVDIYRNLNRSRLRKRCQISPLRSRRWRLCL